MQAQLNICEVEFCDFVVWTPQGMHVERIFRDVDFFEEAVENITSFYKYGVLPELIGKWYSKKCVLPDIDVPVVPVGSPQADDTSSSSQGQLHVPSQRQSPGSSSR